MVLAKEGRDTDPDMAGQQVPQPEGFIVTGAGDLSQSPLTENPKVATYIASRAPGSGKASGGAGGLAPPEDPPDPVLMMRRCPPAEAMSEGVILWLYRLPPPPE